LRKSAATGADERSAELPVCVFGLGIHVINDLVIRIILHQAVGLL
jgi:hypothetical protein